jgi:hypothetical protein
MHNYVRFACMVSLCDVARAVTGIDSSTVARER